MQTEFILTYLPERRKCGKKRRTKREERREEKRREDRRAKKKNEDKRRKGKRYNCSSTILTHTDTCIAARQENSDSIPILTLMTKCQQIIRQLSLQAADKRNKCVHGGMRSYRSQHVEITVCEVMRWQQSAMLLEIEHFTTDKFGATTSTPIWGQFECCDQIGEENA